MCNIDCPHINDCTNANSYLCQTCANNKNHEHNYYRPHYPYDPSPWYPQNPWYPTYPWITWTTITYSSDTQPPNNTSHLETKRVAASNYFTPC